jgi:phosphoheptose isomerase
VPTPEDAPFLVQTSLYGTSKAAAEGYIAAYAEAGILSATVFRFVSVLGPRYSHGHVIDFVRQLVRDPTRPTILGDGSQRKSYMHVSDCVTAVLAELDSTAPFEVLNLGVDGFCTVTDSAGWIAQRLGIEPELEYTGGDRGWIGDNPLIYLDTRKVQARGWRPRFAIREAVESTVDYLLEHRWIIERHHVTGADGAIRYRDATPRPRSLSMTSFSRAFLADSIKILDQLDDAEIEAMVEQVRLTRERGGRIFFCGSGGGAGHASHAACDFRKLARVESYAVTDNVSELTARINDEGWDSSYAEWLKTSKLSDRDCLFVFSVGGGSLDRSISVNLVRAMETAQAVGASIVGVAGRDGGELRARADACVLITSVDEQFVTPQTEGLQALVWHLVVSHPALAPETAKWESVVDASAATTSA